MDIIAQHPTQIPFVNNNHVIETVTPNAADHPLSEWILPRAMRRSHHRFDPKTLHALGKLLIITTVTVAE